MVKDQNNQSGAATLHHDDDDDIGHPRLTSRLYSPDPIHDNDIEKLVSPLEVTKEMSPEPKIKGTSEANETEGNETEGNETAGNETEVTEESPPVMQEEAVPMVNAMLVTDAEQELRLEQQSTDPKPEVAPQSKARKLLWVGGLTALVLVVIIVPVILTRSDPAPPSPTPSPSQSHLLEVLSPVLPESSKVAISEEGTPQFLAFHWLNDSPGVDTLHDYHIRQRYALATLFYATDGTQWSNSDGWLGDEDECYWYSSSIDDVCNAGLLRILHLEDNNLYGALPPDLAMLSNLNYFNLGFNGLTGTIPSFITHLTTLDYVKLYSNQLTGPIPTNLDQLTRLYGLMLGKNFLTGTIPSSITNLTNLEVDLNLVDNSLTGRIPPLL